MSRQKIRRRMPDGSLGPEEDAFPEVVYIDPFILMLTEAVAGLQEQVIMQQAEIEQLKGGDE